ncbi:MAG: hypothetical protein P8188_08525 [Gemmatimonadota bacterium]
MGALSLSVLRTTLHTLPRTLVVPQETDRIHAAVALVLRKRPGVPVELLLIKRAEHPRDPWSGHMALPGGRTASPEVERIRWVTLEALAAPDTLDEIRIDIRGEPRRFPGYRFGDDVVWGLTYRILTDFLDRLRSSPGDPPPAL